MIHICSDGTSKKCNSIEGSMKRYGEFFTWVWNAQKLDKLRKKTKTDMCKMHHYMIYAGQQNWLFKGNEKVTMKRYSLYLTTLG